jgi:hypothetical protein
MSERQVSFPVTMNGLHELTRRISTEFVVATSLEDMYGKLNDKYGPDPSDCEWQLQRAPVWIDDKLVAVMIQWDREYIEYLEAMKQPKAKVQP